MSAISTGAISRGTTVVAISAATSADAVRGNSANVLVSSDVQAVCDWFGPTDLLEMGSGPGGRPIARLLGAPQAHVRGLAVMASPASQIGRGPLPSFLIMHGDVDPIVPLRQSQLFYSRLKQAGADVRFIILPHSGHGDGLFRSNGTFWAVAMFFDHSLKNAHALDSARGATPASPAIAKTTHAG
jgi:acetyl esterase/lipase